jgi:predicted RNA binding protein YcfA (HicA-like mRNA interferase family)
MNLGKFRPKNIPSLKPKAFIKILGQKGCQFYREGKGEHRLYMREIEGRKRIVPIDIGAGKCHQLMCCGFSGNLGLPSQKVRG